MKKRPSGSSVFITAVLLTSASLLPGTSSAAKDKVKDKTDGHTMSIWSHTDDSNKDFSFILVENDGETLSGSGDVADDKEAGCVGRDSGEDIVWARLEGQTYLIMDSALVQRARQAVKSGLVIHQN